MDYNPVFEKIKNGDGRIDFEEFLEPPKVGHRPISLSQIILTAPLRNYFIKKVKRPLMLALAKMGGRTLERLERGENLEDLPLVKVAVAIDKRIPNITKENTTFINTHTLQEIIDEFFEHDGSDTPRSAMFRTAFRILLFEIEHDTYYRDRFNWFIEKIVEAIFRDEWQERTNGSPMQGWSEPGEHGGKYSIINIMKDRQRLHNLLGDKWRLKI